MIPYKSNYKKARKSFFNENGKYYFDKKRMKKVLYYENPKLHVYNDHMWRMIFEYPENNFTRIFDFLLTYDNEMVIMTVYEHFQDETTLVKRKEFC